ncbi:hypothetical protein F1643_03235 [Azospirillum sp. INR13]|uniref:conjugative transfer protein MobI(A/C) n=1 Tax=Azospirillum sp. INR13 TaxID=2596919 RepID=UPI0018920C9D|nr:conjugative transfer protein MobI(A/C) [Azospirillum sp. INR13]MBF5093661.1 hypothetical protein [Azospirillum sp. INR13]
MTLVEDMRAALALERALMVERGNGLAQAFIVHQQQAKEFYPFSEWGQYTLRVRERRVVVSFEWFRTEFRGVRGHRRMIYHTVARGLGPRYPDKAFQHAPAWERQLIQEVENTLEQLRRRAELMLKIEQHLKEYERSCMKGDPLAIYDRPLREPKDDEDEEDNDNWANVPF